MKGKDKEIDVENTSPKEGQTAASTTLPEPQSEESNPTKETVQPTAETAPTPAPEKTVPFALLRERLAHHYADEGADLSDDAIAEDLALRWADEMTSRLATYFDNEGKIKDAIGAYPALQQMLEDIFINRLHPRIALAKAFTAEELTPKEGDADYADYCLLLKHKQDEQENWEKLQNQLEANLTTSHKTIDLFQNKHKLTTPQMELLLKTIDADWEALLQKQITEAMLEGYLKRLNYAEDLATARQAGEYDGRNERIQNLLDTQAVNVAGDRLPHPQTGQYTPNMLNGNKPVIDFSRF